MRITLCDDRGAAGFSWIVDEPATRTSHALADDGRVWLVDPVRHDDALERASALGRPVAVVQLLDRHNRDCASVAAELGVPLIVVPDGIADSPFETIALTRNRAWRETALWWPATRTLVVAEAIGTNEFFVAGGEAAGVQLILRLTPPTAKLGRFAPEHLLVGHGRGLHGPAAAYALRNALAHSRKGLPRLLLRVPGFAADAIRRRR
ncbi:MAG TPA: hypothetical protein VGF10_09655 [Gaiella sp.]|jgi:hypothetical protein